MATHHQTPCKSKQQRLADAVMRLGLLGMLRTLHDRGRSPVLILAYHRIVTVDQPQAYPLDLGIISATAEEFDGQMRAVREFANPVSLDTIADAVTHGHTLPERAVAVTFDDGFNDTFEVAFPRLKRYQIPATVFVSTEHVENDGLYWFELTAHLMMRVPARAIVCAEFPDGLPLADHAAARRDSIVAVHRLLKACPTARRRQLVDEWRTRFAAFIDARACELSRPITRERILQMSREGVDFGSHTVSHPNLAMTADEAVEQELRGSKAYLEQLLGKPVRSLAYPFGTPDTYGARAIAAARACGYELAVSYRQGVNWLGALAPLDLLRIGMSPGVSAAQFRVMLALPAWLHPQLQAE